MTRQSLIAETAVESALGPPLRGECCVEWPSTRAEFEAFVERYQDSLARFALRRLGRVHDAEDAVQEVFLRAYARLGAGNIRRPLAYLYRTTANACTDILRRRKRAPEPLEQATAEAQADRRPDAGAVAAALEELARLETLLTRLPRRQAEVLRLRLWDELSFAEIAQVLGRSPATVKSRFRYGLEKLRTLINREEVHP
jgi:RNA polymerase sigma-70 factor (ECF subfamily)